MTIPSSRSLILWISVFSITSPSADFGRLRQTSDVFGRLRTSSGIFGNDRVVFKNPSTPRIKISRLYLRKSWQVYIKSTVTCKCGQYYKINVSRYIHVVYLGGGTPPITSTSGSTTLANGFGC